MMDGVIKWLIAGPFMYLAITVFLTAAVWKIVKISKLPRHLRWDLYPIAHEPGGSPYQKVDYWTLSREKSLAGELSYMLPEMLLLVKTFKYNRPLWLFSFPMHLGFYLFMGWLVAIVAGAVTELFGVQVAASATAWLPRVLYYAALFLGVTGFVGGLFGSLGLLVKRLTVVGLKEFSSPVTYLNLLLFIGLFGSGLLVWLYVDPAFTLVRTYVASLLVFRPVPVEAPLMLTVIFLFGCFLLYLPFSRMFHFLAKYFFYHKIMWDDEPVKNGSILEQSINAYLHYSTNWSAPHMVPNGSWLTQATTNPTAGGEKNEAQGKN